MYAELLGHLADDLEAGGPTARVLRGHENDAGPSALALRLLGSVHRLVLAGSAPELAPYYPTVGGAWSTDGVAMVVDVLERRAEAVRPLLDKAPQTNEVGRAAALLGGLLLTVERWSLPVRLFEIGASAGLNLLADHFRCTDDRGRAWGDVDSPVVLESAWEGSPLPLEGSISILERGGCDLHPIDVRTEDGRLTLTSYCWPDMAARHARLAGAVALARREAWGLVRTDAATYVDDLTLERGSIAVVWHSVMWQYVPRADQERITTRLAGLGKTASDDAPLVHLFAEPTRRTPDDEHRFWVCADRWPGDGTRAFLGQMSPHGLPVVWE